MEVPPLPRLWVTRAAAGGFQFGIGLVLLSLGPSRPKWSSPSEDTAILAQPRPAPSAQRQRPPTANLQLSDPQK